MSMGKVSLTDGLGSKFATKSCLNIPPRLEHVATLPCEIRISEKWRKSEKEGREVEERGVKGCGEIFKMTLLHISY